MLKIQSNKSRLHTYSQVLIDPHVCCFDLCAGHYLLLWFWIQRVQRWKLNHQTTQSSIQHLTSFYQLLYKTCFATFLKSYQVPCLLALTQSIVKRHLANDAYKLGFLDWEEEIVYPEHQLELMGGLAGRNLCQSQIMMTITGWVIFTAQVNTWSWHRCNLMPCSWASLTLCSSYRFLLLWSVHSRLTSAFSGKTSKIRR